MISETEIQHHFIDRFSETHGEPREGFCSAIYKRAPKEATHLSLEAAAERLIRTKKSKTFPSFAEALSAIAEASHSVVAHSSNAASKIVTQQNYVEMAKDHMRQNASFGRCGAMIEPGTPQWGLWVAYFIAKGIELRRMMQIEAFARRPAIEGEIQWVVTERYMVPCLYPSEFDHDAPSIPTTWGDHLADKRRVPPSSPRKMDSAA